MSNAKDTLSTIKFSDKIMERTSFLNSDQYQTQNTGGPVPPAYLVFMIGRVQAALPGRYVSMTSFIGA